MSTTAQTIITAAYDDIGVYAPGEALQTSDLTDGLRRLNQLVSLWKTQNLTALIVTKLTFDVVANTQEYTIGPGGDFDTPRPMRIEGAGLRLPTGIEIPIAVITDDAWQAISIKEQTGTQWTQLYYNPTITGGLGTIDLWPIPTTAANDCVIYVPTQTEAFDDLTTPVILAPGYEEAFEYNLALRLALPHGKTIEPNLRELATAALSAIKVPNVKMADLSVDDAMTAYARGYSYNILSDTGA